MLAPSDIEQLKGDNSRYAVVVGVAKRARQIAEEYEQEGRELIEKPVSLAIKDFKDGHCTLVVPSDDGDEE